VRECGVARSVWVAAAKSGASKRAARGHRGRACLRSQHSPPTRTHPTSSAAHPSPPPLLPTWVMRKSFIESVKTDPTRNPNDLPRSASGGGFGTPIFKREFTAHSPPPRSQVRFGLCGLLCRRFGVGEMVVGVTGGGDAGAGRAWEGGYRSDRSGGPVLLNLGDILVLICIGSTTVEVNAGSAGPR